MKLGRRAFIESLVLHGLLAAAMIAMAGSLTPPPRTIRLDFSMLEPGEPKSPPVTTKISAPPKVIPAPAPRPKPAVSPRPQRPKHVVVKPKPVPAELKPAPSKPLEPTPEVTAAPEPAPSPPAPPAPENSSAAAQVPATVDRDAVPAGDTAGQALRPVAGGVAAVEEYRHANFGTIRSSILANLRYPLLARRQGWSGLVEVAFLVAPDGNVSDLRIQASSGFPVLDDQALAAVRRSAPFTPPRIAALLVVPVTFRLN